MTRVIIAVLGIVLSVTFGVGHAFAQLQWDSMKVKADVPLAQDKVKATFRFKNVGTTPIEIKSAEASCECISVEIPRRKFGPGDTGTMDATVDVLDQQGETKEEILVYTDAAAAAPVTLQLELTFPVLFTVKDTIQFWRAGEAAEWKTTRIEIVRTAPIKIHLDPVVPDGAEAAVDEKEKGKVYEVRLRPRSTQDEKTYRVDLKTDLPAPRDRLPIYIGVLRMPTVPKAESSTQPATRPGE